MTQRVNHLVQTLPLRHLVFATIAVGSLALATTPRSAAADGTVPPIFADADLELGEEMIAEHKCNACHIRRFGGDGSSIYRPGQRLTTAGFLRGMVEQCNTELNLQMFPDEVTSVSAVLNRDHYHFKK